MSILNVVQPEELDPSSFTLIDDKLHVAISAKEDNILQYKNDGLYAPAGGGGVLERYIYTFDEVGNATHKGIRFQVIEIDGALQGQVHGINFDDVTPNDVIFYNGQFESAWYDDEKYVIGLPWGVEHMQRVILKLHKDGKPALWVAKVIRNKNSGFGELGVVTLVIDEMVNVGDLTSNPGELEPQPVDGDITIMGYSNTLNGDRIAIIGMQGNRIGIARVEGEDGSVSIADTHFGTLAFNYNDPTNQNIKAYMGYCPLLGCLLYHDGTNYNLMMTGGTPAVTDLPDPDFNTGTAGVGLSLSDGRDGAYIYSMDAQSFSYQRILDTRRLELTSVTTIDAPTDGVIKDYLVSGDKVAYLLTKNDMYVLHITDLYSGDVTEYPLIPYNEEDQRAKLINGSLGSVFVYIDKVQEQVLVGVVATLDMSTYTLNMTQVEPTVLDGPLLSIDPLSHVSFHLDQTFSSYDMFLSPEDMSIVRVGSSLMAGGVEVAKAPIPANYLSLLMSGKMSVPFTGGPAAIAYDASPNGYTISFEELEIGEAGGGMYESVALLRFPAIGKTATLALSSSNTISLFSSDFDGNIDTSVNYIDQEQPYAKILNGVFVWDQNAHAAAWVSDNKRVYLARFDTTTIVPVITELGESINDHPWLEISHTSNGDVHLSEKLSNTGIAINVWKVDINNTEVVPYFKESIRDETATFEGEHLCGNKLVAFESPVGGSGLRFRTVNVETNESIVSGEFPHIVFANCLFANLTGNTFVVINKLFAEGTWESIGTRVLMVTINETEIIVKDTGVLPLLNAKTLVIGSLSAGVDGDGSNVVNFYADEGGVSYIFRITDLNGEIGLSRQQVTSEMIQGAGIALQDGLPAVVFISSNTAYIQHDFKLSSFKTFPLTMEKYDNSPRATALNATWNEGYGNIDINGRLDYIDNAVVNYAHLEVETPSGQIHTAKYRIGTNTNGEVKRNLWAIAEPGEYIFRLRHWDGGEALEARATVPSEGKDFRAPIVTPTGDGEWLFSTENTEAGERGVFNVYRSRHPVSIIEDFDRDGYVYDNIHTTPPKYRIPSEERNGIWYIIVGHSGALSKSIWTPTFFTYGE